MYFGYLQVCRRPEGENEGIVEAQTLEDWPCLYEAGPIWALDLYERRSGFREEGKEVPTCLAQLRTSLSLFFTLLLAIVEIQTYKKN